jgi:hypothetical protein
VLMVSTGALPVMRDWSAYIRKDRPIW